MTAVQGQEAKDLHRGEKEENAPEHAQRVTGQSTTTGTYLVTEAEQGAQVGVDGMKTFRRSWQRGKVTSSLWTPCIWGDPQQFMDTQV